MENNRKILCLIFLAGCCLSDIRKRRVSNYWLGVFFLLGMLLDIYEKKYLFAFAGAAPGAVLFVFSLISGEKIGKGDALSTGVSGIYAGMWGSLSALLIGSALASAWGGGMHLIKHCSLKKEMIFTPFLMTGYLVYVLLGGSL